MWRRDPIFSRTPIRRSTDSVIRSSRCFSKSIPTYARHNDESDNNEDKKPEGTSDLEWMRQRYSRRWRKRIEEDPYSALFGASEDMLRGRGLERYMAGQRELHKKGLEWVQKTFPKWMLEDMGLGDKEEGPEAKTEKNGDKYPKKVKLDAAEEDETKERKGMFPQPSYRRGRFERDFWNEGVESPSDSRRPREQPTHHPFQSPQGLYNDEFRGLRKDIEIPQELMQQKDTHAKTQDLDKESSPGPAPAPKSNAQYTKDGTARETSFIEEFLAEKTSSASPTTSENVHFTSKDWLQTALERRAALNSAPDLRRKTDVPVIDVTAKDRTRTEKDSGTEQDMRSGPVLHGEPGPKTEKAVIHFHGAPSSRVGRKEIEDFASKVDETSKKAKPCDTLANIADTTKGAESTPQSKNSPYPKINTDDWVIAQKRDTVHRTHGFSNVKLENPSTKDITHSQTNTDASVNPRRSASDILKQLPEDDLDFLSADDIRASMGRTKGVREDKNAVRQKLEEEYNKEIPQIDPLLEAQVMNDQYVRRKTSEMSQAPEQTRATENEPSTAVPEQKRDVKPVSVLETSLDFMSRWLHTGGNVLAMHFWQDPVQLIAGELSGADEEFLKGIGMGVVKGRRAFASIKDELVEDIPTAKNLVIRLNRDEIKASAGAVRLYRDLPSALKDMSDAVASKAAAHARIGKLRQAILDTDKQFREACEGVDNMKSTTNPSFLQQRRLRFASEVLCKNAKLTRMAIFGLQARIEVEAGTSRGLVAKELLHRLLALQDTQLALSRLVSRTMQVLGIPSKAEEEEAATESVQPAVDLADPSVVEALASVATKNSAPKQTIDTVAANEKLEEEVSKQKAAMRGLSDDGYTHSPKPVVRKGFEEANPLAHSLFRPFGLQLGSLGKDVDAEKEGVVDAAKEKGDRELVKEVRKAYEDVHGTISVDHWQVPPEAQRITATGKLTKEPEVKDTKKKATIQMLKEDEVSPSITSETLSTTNDTTSTSGDNVAVTTNVPEVGIASNELKNGAPAMVEDLRPLYTSDLKPIRHASSTFPEADRLEKGSTFDELEDAHESLAKPTVLNGDEYSYDASAERLVPIYYRTLIYNAETDKLSVATSQVPQPNPPISPIPLHEALATLSHPANFVDHLPEAFHVIAVKPDVLSVRTASPFSATAEKNDTIVIDKLNTEHKVDTEEPDGWRGINPVDGTTTLSPTGFVGVASDLEREVDFAERRRKADEYNREVNRSRQNIETPEKKRRGRIGAGGVVKTAIWAGAVCYIVGVAAEVAKAPF